MSVQVIQLSERLEEAEGGAESQVNSLFIKIMHNLTAMIICTLRKEEMKRSKD